MTDPDFASSNLWIAARQGALQHVKHLVEIEQHSLDSYDEWMATPLYYAALCGHVEVVKYLLSMGARCEEHTFDGDRCLYAALTDELRALLRNHRPVERTPSPFLLMMERFFATAKSTGDVAFKVGGELLHCHRFILAGRCGFFNKELNNRWRNQSCISIKRREFSTVLLRALFRYLYLGRLQFPSVMINEMLSLLQQCQLEVARVLVQDFSAKISKHVNFAMTKHEGRPMSHPDFVSIQADDGILGVQRDLAALTVPHSKITPFSDIVFTCQRSSFCCHSLIFVDRSDYFRALLSGNFSDVQRRDDGRIAVVIEDVDATTFGYVVRFLYGELLDKHEDVENIPILQLIEASEIFLLPALKHVCISILIGFVNADNVIDMMILATHLEDSRLEDRCTFIIAEHLDLFLGDSRFEKLVVESAQSITMRQETDSIPLVDDIRAHLETLRGPYVKADLDDNQDYIEETIYSCQSQKVDQLLLQLDQMLIRLGIEC